MSIPLDSLDVQIESLVDFASLKRNEEDMQALISAQKMFEYFQMINGPTYVNLVKEFWIRAEVCDVESAKSQESQVVSRNPSLKGKSRVEMGLEPFKGLEIKSAVMGITVSITKGVIAKACRMAPEGRFLWNVNRKDALLESYTNLLLNGNPATKLVDMDIKHRILLKMLNECFFQKGGGAYQPSLDHKLVLYFLAAFQPINLPRYIMHHLCWAIKEGSKGKRKQVLCGRLLSEIFCQGGVPKTLDKFNLLFDRVLGIATGRMISGKTLFNMKVTKKVITDVKDLKESSAPSQTLRDFPSILKEDNPEALTGYLAAFAKEFEDATKKAEVVLARKQKSAKSEATNYDIVAAPKRKRGKGDSTITMAAAKLALEEIEAEEVAGLERPPKRKAGEEIVSPMFIVTPEMEKRSQEYCENLKNEKKRLEAQYRIDRDEQLKAMGLEHCDQPTIEQIIEVQTLARKVEEEALKGAKKVLKETLGTSEADASESVPQVAVSEAATSEVAASEAAVSKATKSEKVSQIPVPQTTLSPSSSTDSDLDNIPLSQKYNLTKRTSTSKTTSKLKLSPKTKPFKPVHSEILKTIGELSERRVGICNRLPSGHPFQPPIIKPLNMLPAGVPIPSSSKSNQSPNQGSPKVVDLTATAEEHVVIEEPTTAELSLSDSTTNKQQQTTSSPLNQPSE